LKEKVFKSVGVYYFPSLDLLPQVIVIRR